MTPVALQALRLSGLLSPWLGIAPEQDRPISLLTLDSREVQPGAVFAALPGAQRHGLAYLEEALRRQATAVLYEGGEAELVDAAAARCAVAGVPLIELPDLAMQLSAIAGRFYGDPSEQLQLIGVTGTDGKTSTSQFIAQALSEGLLPCGVIGTLGYGMAGSLVPTTHTTPDAITVQRLLADMRGLGARHAVMEVSSHALVQGRVGALRFEVAVLTNLTRDHLDYHGTQEAYAEAKARLFAMPGLKHVVLNRDDLFSRSLRKGLAEGVQVWDYSLAPTDRRAAVVCRELEFLHDGLRLQVSAPGGSARFQVPLWGRFNAANTLATLTTLLALGLPLEEAVRRLEGLSPVIGRMERFGGGDDAPEVLVDYAHTPGGLAAALDAVRQHAFGRVWCVFGCGGDRDRGKRAKMGEIADRKADEIVLTDDNPRTEDPDAIIAEIMTGLQGHEPYVVRDRAAAIRLAVTSAEPGDAVLVAGKGHETCQIVGTRRRAYDDREQVRLALRELKPWN